MRSPSPPNTRCQTNVAFVLSQRRTRWTYIPTRYPPNIGLMLTHRLRRWANNKPISGEYPVFDGMEPSQQTRGISPVLFWCWAYVEYTEKKPRVCWVHWVIISFSWSVRFQTKACLQKLAQLSTEYNQFTAYCKAASQGWYFTWLFNSAQSSPARIATPWLVTACSRRMWPLATVFINNPPWRTQRPKPETLCGRFHWVWSGDRVFYLRHQVGAWWHVTLYSTFQPAQYVGTMLIHCWANVIEGGPTLDQHRANLLRRLGFHVQRWLPPLTQVTLPF